MTGKKKKVQISEEIGLGPPRWGEYTIFVSISLKTRGYELGAP